MRLFPKSLRLKVLINVFITSLLMLVLFGWVIYNEMASLTSSVTQERLLAQAKQIASFIEYDWRGRFEVDMPRNYQDYYSSNHHQFAVLNSGGEVLFYSEGFIRSKIKDTLDKGGKHYFNFKTEEGKHFAGLKYDYLFEDKIYPVYVIEYEQEFSQFIATLGKDFFKNILSLGIPLLILQGFIILLIFRSAFKPVLKASKETRKIKYDNLSFRLNEKNVHSELSPLIKSVNNSLARLEKSAEAQKLFIANAAHELRTPLSILKARIASLKNEKEVFMLNEDLRNINRLISQMLDISRLDMTEAIPKEDVNLNKIVQKACADMGGLFIAADKELSLEEHVENQIINGNEDTLFRALLNLLENALKHTPDKTAVNVIVAEKRVTVRDYGRPIDEANKIKIFERFEKAPESTGTKGSGLGLSIVKKAAEIHNGTITLTTRENGNDFILDFS